MRYRDSTKKLQAYRREIADIRKKMRKLQADVEPEVIDDYELATLAGARRLSELFGDKDDLIVIHNMGAGCSYCTLWADGFNGLYDHIADRAAFVVVTPDRPAAQKKFAESRGWRFPMASHDGTSFAADMGYRSERGLTPGVSVFQRRDGKILRVSDTGMSPRDDFCAVWHLFDLLPESAAGWSPKFKYAAKKKAA
jgi:predicted dithiol-disulfide oxidoreductase (DUF899 family)